MYQSLNSNASSRVLDDKELGIQQRVSLVLHAEHLNEDISKHAGKADRAPDEDLCARLVWGISLRGKEELLGGGRGGGYL